MLQKPLDAERLTIASASGELSVYTCGAGPPLLLVHSINAAASAAEVKPLQRHFSATHRVFAPDLPGYGLSERRDLPYSPESMTEALDATVALIQRLCGPQPIDALALSLSCEYLARSAVRLPQAYRSVALVSPTGFRGKTAWRRAPGSDRGIPWLYRLLRGPTASRGRFIFAQLTRPRVIRYFLERTWGSKRIDEELLAYDIETARVSNAEYAPLRFLSGFLFSADIHTVYEGLTLPVWMSHGVRGDFTDYRNQVLVADRANWSFTVYPTGALPHFEVPEEFCADYEKFLGHIT